MPKIKELNWGIPLLSLIFIVLLTMGFSFLPFEFAFKNLLLGLISVGITGAILFKKKWREYVAPAVGVILMYFIFAVLPFNYAGLNMADQMISNGLMVVLGAILGDYLKKAIVKM